MRPSYQNHLKSGGEGRVGSQNLVLQMSEKQQGGHLGRGVHGRDASSFLAAAANPPPHSHSRQLVFFFLLPMAKTHLATGQRNTALEESSGSGVWSLAPSPSLSFSASNRTCRNLVLFAASPNRAVPNAAVPYGCQLVESKLEPALPLARAGFHFQRQRRRLRSYASYDSVPPNLPPIEKDFSSSEEGFLYQGKKHTHTHTTLHWRKI